MNTKQAVFAAFLIMALLIGLCSCSAADELTEPLNRSVPFGIAHMDDGSGIPVYRSMTARTASDRLNDYQVCAILASQTYNKVNWLRIRYVSGNAIREGYIRETGFYQLTVAGLITVASDAPSSAALRALAADAKANVFTAQATPAATATPRPTKKITATPSPTPRSKKATATPSAVRKRYVLNTKTMKFHLPGCSELDRTAAENKKTTITTRTSLIDQGYTPCQRCKP